MHCLTISPCSLHCTLSAQLKRLAMEINAVLSYIMAALAPMSSPVRPPLLFGLPSQAGVRGRTLGQSSLHPILHQGSDHVRTPGRVRSLSLNPPDRRYEPPHVFDRRLVPTDQAVGGEWTDPRAVVVCDVHHLGVRRIVPSVPSIVLGSA